jgi:type IV pilus assembly protein PilC
VAYPATVLVLMLLVVVVLLVKVLPVFDRVYASLGSRLTGPAAGLLYAGQLLEAGLPVLFVLLLILAAGAAVLRFSPAIRSRMAAAWQRRYGDRGIGRKFNNARFARALAMGLSSGLPLDESMSLAENLLRDAPGAADRCRRCAKAMEAGEMLGKALEEARLLPPAQCRLLQIGERSGNGDQIMEQIADSMMEEAQNALEQRVSAIEPAMVLASSVLVGLILMSVMLPLADILAVLG